MKKYTFFWLFFSGIYSLKAQQQDSTKKFKISGDVDLYYRYNAGGYKYPDSYTSFTQTANSFELGMASVKLESSALSEKVDAVIDIGFGSRARDFSYNDSGMAAIVKQAYLIYKLSDHVKFTAGKFATHIGYELVDPMYNNNYSMSYMFTNGPFFHTGVKGTINFGKMEFSAGIADHFDQTISKSSTRDVLGQILFTPNDKWSYALNYWGFYGENQLDPALGVKDMTQFDFVISGKVSPYFHVGANTTAQLMVKPHIETEEMQTHNWWGAAIYLNYDPNEKIDISLRSEFINDDNKIKFASKNISAQTLTFDYKIGPLNLMPEIRYDVSKDPIFFSSNGNMKKSTFSLLMAAIYKF
jgi:hypothetical protein